MHELHHYSTWKVQMLNCHYSAVWFSHLLFHMGIVYIHILLKLSVYKDFCTLYVLPPLICFNLLFNCLCSKVMNICCWHKGVIFQPSYMAIYGVCRLIEFFFYLSREFLDVYESENSMNQRIPTCQVSLLCPFLSWIWCNTKANSSWFHFKML